jgi:hypothetical protein
MFKQGLAYFVGALKSIGDSWMLNHGWMDKFNYDLSSYKENVSPEELGMLYMHYHRM